MVELFEHLCLAEDHVDILGIANHLGLDDLDGHFLFGLAVHAEHDLAEPAFA